MSRISGVVRNAGGSGRRLVQQMLAAVANRSWSTKHVCSNGFHLGWTGWERLRCVQDHGLLAAVDGHFYNREDLVNDPDEATALISLYRQHSFIDAVRRINGDFAVALFDADQRTLWLARDRMGVKPLYYVNGHDGFAFASRPRSLLGLAGMRRDVDRRFVATFAASHYRYIDNEPTKSPYKDIFQLPAAHTLRFKDGSVSLTRYWSLEDEPDLVESEVELANRYRDLLLDAVRIRIRTAKSPAYTLSGGMDSSSVLASAVEILGSKQHAFSTVYSDKTYDESDEIQSMLDSTVERWHAVEVGNPDVFEVIDRLVRLHDEPVATATWLSHYLLCDQAAREGFGSLFGGLGGDELNAGEFEHFPYFFADLRKLGEEKRLDHEIAKWIEYHDHPIYRKSYGLVEHFFQRIVDLNRPGKCLPDLDRLMRYRAALNPDYFDLERFHPVMEHPFSSHLKNRTYQDLTRETIPCCLRAEDRQSTTFGLDCMMPFFDHRLIEFMFRVPVTMKYDAGVTKALLRRAMNGILPDETRTRVKKTGWNAPAHLWFSNSSPDLMDLIRSQRFRERGVYDTEEVERIVEEHREIMAGRQPRENHMMFLWQLVNLEMWFRCYID